MHSQLWNRTLLACAAIGAWTAASLVCDAAPPAAACTTVVAGEVGARLDRWLSSADFRGAVLVARGGTIELRKGYGMADREQGIPYVPETVATIGSITKQFTAAAILKLEMQGRLRVEDPIGKWLPGVPEDKRAITLHHLLTHTAGLESDFAGDYDAVGRDEYVSRILASELRGAPGAAYHYANSGYSLLGAIVEIASGRPYEAYLRDELFVPAGMRDTGYTLPGSDTRRMAVGYRDGERWGRSVEKPWAADGPYWALRANGGLLSTVDDLLRWHVALAGEAVLSAAAKAKLYARHVREGQVAQTYYGYGWSIADSPWGGPLVAHNGGNRVFYADFQRFLDEDLVVILFTNDSTVRGGRIAESLARLAHGEDVPPPARSDVAARPLGAAGRDAVIRAWIDAFNAADLAPMRTFRAAHAAPRPGMDDTERERRLQALRDDLGRLEPEAVVGQSEGETTLRTRSGRGVATLRFVFTDDGKLEGVGVEVGD
jgi:CubicO group peptidase (beta-lactamase class C family)